MLNDYLKFTYMLFGAMAMAIGKRHRKFNQERLCLGNRII
jgi:hypothetical protein